MTRRDVRRAPSRHRGTNGTIRPAAAVELVRAGGVYLKGYGIIAEGSVGRAIRCVREAAPGVQARWEVAFGVWGVVHPSIAASALRALTPDEVDAMGLARLPSKG